MLTGNMLVSSSRRFNGLRAIEGGQQFLGTNIETSGEAIVACTPAGMILSWNQGAETVFGHSAAEAVGKPFSMLVAPEWLPSLAEFIEHILLGNAVPRAEGLCRHKDGRRISVFVKGFPVRNSTGAVAGICAIIHRVAEQRESELAGISAIATDNRERMRCERNSWETVSHFREVFEHAPFGICVTGLDGRFIQVNKAFGRIVGYSPQELHGKSFADLTYPDDPEHAPWMKDELWIDPDATVETEKRCIHGLGSALWVRMKISLGRDSFGNPSYYVVHVEDITERKQSEQARQFQLSLIRAIHEVSLDGILVVNDESTIVSHNKRFLDVWQIVLPYAPDNLPENVIGTSDRPLLASVLARVKDPETFLNRVREVYANPDVDDHCEIELKDGRTLERYSTKLRSEKGQYLGRVWFFRDITGRKQSEDAFAERRREVSPVGGKHS